MDSDAEEAYKKDKTRIMVVMMIRELRLKERRGGGGEETYRYSNLRCLI